MKVEWLPGDPTEPGLYWYCYKGASIAKGGSQGALRHCYVAFVDGELRELGGRRRGGPVKGSYRRWAGPLPEPKTMPLDIVHEAYT